jgi:hypothetical protein
MKVLIHAVDAAQPGALDLAGRPLLLRQLQALRELGLEDVVVEIVDGPLANLCADLVLSNDPLCARSQVLPSAAPLGVEELARRAGLVGDELFLALPANVAFAEVELALPDSPRNVLLGPPPYAPERKPLALAFRTRDESPTEEVSCPGWALVIDDVLVAHGLSCAAIAGQADGVLVHAAEVRPGIWYARGARVAEAASLSPPVLIGPDARVFGAARLGPNVIMGRGAVVEREAVLSEVSIAPFTLVGEDARIRQAFVDAAGFTSFVDGSRSEIRDELLLASTAPSPVGLGARAGALLLTLALLLPWFVTALFARLVGRRAIATEPLAAQRLRRGILGVPVLDLIPALVDALRGRRHLVGFSVGALREAGNGCELARSGALSLDRALASYSADTRAALVAWYTRNKSARVDRELLARALRGGPRRGAAQRTSGSF